MSDVILLCGMICSGKSTYAARLEADAPRRPLVLSLDELMLSLFEPYMGDAYAPMLAKATAYLYVVAERAAAAGVDVVLDFGFWRRADRDAARARFEALGHRVELRYLPVAPGEWERRVDRRNAEVRAGKKLVYSLDANMRAAFPARFHPPEADEEYVTVDTTE